MKRASVLVAVVLVVLLAWANVGMSGQRDRLREKVRVLDSRVTSLEAVNDTQYQLIAVVCQEVSKVKARVAALDGGEFGTFCPAFG